MGIYDRDYIRESSRGGFGEFVVWSATTWIVILNVAAFVFDGLARRAGEPRTYQQFLELQRHLDAGDDFLYGFGPLAKLGYFSMTKAVYGLQLWRLVTFQFVHAGAGHLFGNMLGIFFFGPIVEGHFGARRYLAFY